MRHLVARLAMWDTSLAEGLLRRPIPRWFDCTLRRLTHLGGATATLSVGGALTLLPPVRRIGLVLLAGNIGSHLVVQVLKRTVARARPATLARIAFPDAWSFPSGHAAAAMALAVGTLLEVGPAACLVLPIALLVGASRVWLGVHYPSDVLVGQTLGATGAILAHLLVP